MRRGASTAMLVAGLLLPAGCGGGDDSAPEAREASCALEGSGDATVTVLEEDDAFTVTWDGHPVPDEGGFDYVVQLTDEAAEVVAQLTVKYVDGAQALFAAGVDGPEYSATKVDAEAKVDGDRVVAVFPKGDGVLVGLGVTGWNGAAYSRDLKVGGRCPKDERFLPFP